MTTSENATASTPFWREAPFWILLALAASFYLPRLTALSVCGEESRWATVAREMQASGDWVVPRQQGNVFPERPPLGSWLMMLVGQLRGDVDLVAIRLPSVLATIMMGGILYWYARNFLSALGAMTAGLAYVTMGQVLQLGRQGESEAVFTCLLASSLLVWHANYLHGRRIYRGWIVGGVLAGLAALTKGLQAPVYFVLVTNAWCLTRRDWRGIFSFAQLSGLLTGTAVVMAWLVPFWLRTSPADVTAVWCGLAADRFNLLGLTRHLVTYPFETIACTLPGSLAILPLFRRSVRERLALKPWLGDLALALAVTYPSVLLASGARGRYFMPLYPLIAVVAAMVIEQLLVERTKVYTRLVAGIACLCGLVYLGPVMQSRLNIENDIRPDVARVQSQLPPGAQLVSFGPIAHRFNYTYQRPIDELPWPNAADVAQQVEYFCFDEHPGDTPAKRANGRGRTWGTTSGTLPFAWDEIERIPCDPRTRGASTVSVIVGRVRRDENLRQSLGLANRQSDRQ